TRWPRDWSSDVCSSDLEAVDVGPGQEGGRQQPERGRRVDGPGVAQQRLPIALAAPGDRVEPEADRRSDREQVAEGHARVEPRLRSEERRVGKEGKWRGR